MNPYPKTISEAAVLLDSAHQGWAKKIDIDKLDMQIGRCCILGQLYGDYVKGMKVLFQMNGRVDDVFGCNASNKSWKTEIMERLKMQDVGTWKWAVDQMKDNKVVRRKGWINDTTWSMMKVGNEKVIIANNNPYFRVQMIETGFEATIADDWEIVQPRLALADVKTGQKFKFNEDGPIYIKMRPNSASKSIDQQKHYFVVVSDQYAIIAKEHDDNSEVILVE